MSAHDFEFILDSGYIFYVCAESRKEAVKLFLEQHGMAKDFFDRHCTVKNMGRIKNNAAHW